MPQQMSATEGIGSESLTFQTGLVKTEPGSSEERAKKQAHMLGQMNEQTSCEKLDTSGAPLSATVKITKQHRIAGESPVRNTVLQGVS